MAEGTTKVQRARATMPELRRIWLSGVKGCAVLITALSGVVDGAARTGNLANDNEIQTDNSNTGEQTWRICSSWKNQLSACRCWMRRNWSKSLKSDLVSRPQRQPR